MNPPVESEQGHLLIVDDEEDLRLILSQALRLEGHSVQEASDGHQGLKMIEEGDFDLVLLDIMMPTISGLEVLEKLRESYTAAELPVIMISANSASEDIVGALQRGANDYVPKPLDVPVLRARVNTQLSLLNLRRDRDRLLERLHSIGDSAP